MALFEVLSADPVTTMFSLPPRGAPSATGAKALRWAETLRVAAGTATGAAGETVAALRVDTGAVARFAFLTVFESAVNAVYWFRKYT